MISSSARVVSKHVFLKGRNTSQHALRSIFNFQLVNITQCVENDLHVSKHFYSGRKHYATSSKKAKPKTTVESKKTTAAKSKSPLKKSKVVAKKSKKPVKKPVEKLVKKKPIKKKPIKKKPGRKARVVPKKRLTEEEKLKLKQKKLKDLVLSPPDTLPKSGRYVFYAKVMTGQGKMVKEIIKNLSSDWDALSKEEQDHYQAIADRNQAVNEDNYNKWLQGFTPDQIRLANNARAYLNKFTDKPGYAMLEDIRRPKRAMTPFMLFVKDSFAADTTKSLKIPESMRLLSERFKSLPQSERKNYDDIYRVSQERYLKEFRDAFKRESQSSANTVNQKN